MNITNYFDEGFVCEAEIMIHPDSEDEDTFDYSNASRFYRCKTCSESKAMMINVYRVLDKLLDGQFENEDNVTVIVKVIHNKPLSTKTQTLLGDHYRLSDNCPLNHPITASHFKAWLESQKVI